MGLHRDKSPAIFLGKITGDLLGESNVTTYIYKPVQPLATIKRHIVIIPSQAEKEAGFLMWLHKIGNLARNTGTKIVVYAPLGIFCSGILWLSGIGLYAEYDE